jgi:Spy/CpxP family protein refolding chaperone
MKFKIILSMLIASGLIFWGLPVFAQGSDILSMMGGNSQAMGGGMMGGGNQGMGGGQYRDNKNQQNPNYAPNKYSRTEMEDLKYEIRKKREELMNLFKSENPDRNQINQKINELNELEYRRDEVIYNQ